MEYLEISEKDYTAFQRLANVYYREGEDENTPQEEMDGFIRFLFDKVISKEIDGCFASIGGECMGFALWAVDTEDFVFSEIPGFGTIMEIGILLPYRKSGRGKEFVSYIEARLRNRGIRQCYVCAYGPAQRFWAQCGYVENGQTGKNDLPIMIKQIAEP